MTEVPGRPLWPPGTLGRVTETTLAHRRKAYRRRDDHDIALAANRFLAVFSALSDGIIVTDENAIIVDANPAARRHLGRPDLFGVNLGDLLPPGRAEVIERRDERLVRRWRLAAEDREVVLEAVTTPTLDELGRAVGAVHTVRDITAQAQLMRLKEEFLFDVAHELRSPIASLTASLELLHQDAPTMSRAEVRAMVGTLRRSALRLHALVENLLDAGSIQAGTFAVRAVATSVRRCINDALLVTRPLLDGKQQVVQVHIPRGCDRVVADPRRTAQIFANLFSNAAKYGPDKGHIAVSAEAAEGFVKVMVRDQGPGIPKEDRARVFDRFYRSPVVRDEVGGIGLGLHICRAIVEAQGGRVGVDSPPEGGTIVHFTVPRARTSEG